MSKRLFKKDATYEDIKDIIQEKLPNYYTNYTKELIQNGVSSFVLLKEEKRVVSFSKRVDEIYTKEKLERQKLPTILYGFILLYSYKDYAKQLSDDALALLSHNMVYSFKDVESIQEQTRFTTPNILETIVNKTTNSIKRDDYYTISEMLYINSDKKTKEEKENYVSEKIKNMSESEFHILYEKYCSYHAEQTIANNMGIKI